jgi:RNA polymerase sigma-70 factor (ECF subfamily)
MFCSRLDLKKLPLPKKNLCTFPQIPVWIYMEGKKQMTARVESMDNALLMKGTAQAADASGSLDSQDSHDKLDNLVLRVLRGDIEAFNEIMLETEGKALGLAWRLLGDREQAKDACQEAFLRAFKSLGTYRIGESFVSWIRRIVANVCCDHAKKREYGYTDPQVLEQMPAPESDCAEDAVLRQQQRGLVDRALKTLAPAERSALVLRDLEGMSTDEAAQVLGHKPGTVRANVASARAKIKNYCRKVLQSTKGGSL